jgi:hypothetical protein
MLVIAPVISDQTLALRQRLRACALVLGALGMAAVHSAGFAQSLAPNSAQSGVVQPVSSDALRWAQLSAVQKQALSPLEASWNSLTEDQARKWLAVAQNFSALDPSAQQKLQMRMTEWASLSPKDREFARLNFAETKKIAPSDPAANWETYRALSPEEKQKLAEKGAHKPVGAAVAIKPVPKQKLAEVPVTRRTPEQAPAVAKFKHSIDRNTLLPQTTRTASSNLNQKN